MPDGLVYDRLSFTWVTPEEMERRKAYREEQAFLRKPRQGEVTAPMIISDSLGVHGLQSMADGKFYDSKSAMRRHYKEAGVVEVGDMAPSTKGPIQRPDRAGISEALHRAKAKVDTMSDESIKARRHERETKPL